MKMGSIVIMEVIARDLMALRRGSDTRGGGWIGKKGRGMDDRRKLKEGDKAHGGGKRWLWMKEMEVVEQGNSR